MLGRNKQPQEPMITGVEHPNGPIDRSGRLDRQGIDEIPYEVYQTIHEPGARRRRWAVRLTATLLAATLLVVGGLSLHDKISKSSGDSKGGASSGAVQPGSSGNSTQSSGSASYQSPQTNAPIQKPSSEPVNTPQSDTTNTGTVQQPQ